MRLISIARDAAGGSLLLDANPDLEPPNTTLLGLHQVVDAGFLLLLSALMKAEPMILHQVSNPDKTPNAMVSSKVRSRKICALVLAAYKKCAGKGLIREAMRQSLTLNP